MAKRKKKTTRKHHLRKTKNGKLVPIRSHPMTTTVKEYGGKMVGVHMAVGKGGMNTAFSMKDTFTDALEKSSKKFPPTVDKEFVKRVKEIGKGRKSPI